MATHHEIPEHIDIIAYLFGDEGFNVPESRFTPELKAQFYERALRDFPIKLIHSKGPNNPSGLQTLPNLLRTVRTPYGTEWLKLVAPTDAIRPALPHGVPYQLLYLPLFNFELPTWTEVPLKAAFDGKITLMGEFGAELLVLGRDAETYFVQTRWKPDQEYFGGADKPRSIEDGPYVFDLSHLSVEQIEWNDKRILERIENGKWSDLCVFLARLESVLGDTARILENRARNMRSDADRFRKMSIFPGR